MRREETAKMQQEKPVVACYRFWVIVMQNTEHHIRTTAVTMVKVCKCYKCELQNDEGIAI